jgi:oleate hydratase
MKPFITSQFLRRAKGDRPQVVPERSKNLAFIGQFCELPEDVVHSGIFDPLRANSSVLVAWVEPDTTACI